MKLKVIESSLRTTYSVVRAEYGEKRSGQYGEYSYEPIPLCRVPVGYGRTSEEALSLAEKIARLLEWAETHTTI